VVVDMLTFITTIFLFHGHACCKRDVKLDFGSKHYALLSSRAICPAFFKRNFLAHQCAICVEEKFCSGLIEGADYVFNSMTFELKT